MLEQFIIDGGIPLRGDVSVSGAKNVALKVLIASLLTPEPITIRNVPMIADVRRLLDILAGLGASYEVDKHTVTIQTREVTGIQVPLEAGAKVRTSSLVIGPLLSRTGYAEIPNPGGCRLGARPIDRHIQAIRSMGAEISYNPDDGYFHAKASRLRATKYRYDKNSHTGTEALILAAVLAEGTTVIENAAEEVEIDDLIACLVKMGAKIKRSLERTIVIDGVKSLKGCEFTIMSDRNEEVTYAIAAAVTGGSITVNNSRRQDIGAFLEVFRTCGGTIEPVSDTRTLYGRKDRTIASHIRTSPHPGFMTDWQAPWALFMTQATGISTIHETIFENRFNYVSELTKMGAKIEFFHPTVKDPETYYNFRWSDRTDGSAQGIRIHGPTELHNAVLEMHDIRAGATIVIAALSATGRSFLSGVEQIDRGYEAIDERIRSLGGSIRRVKNGGVI